MTAIDIDMDVRRPWFLAHDRQVLPEWWVPTRIYLAVGSRNGITEAGRDIVPVTWFELATWQRTVPSKTLTDGFLKGLPLSDQSRLLSPP